MSVRTILMIAYYGMKFINSLMRQVERAQLKGEVRAELIGEQALLLAGQTASAKQIKEKVAKWSDEQLDDFLSQPRP